MHALVRRLGVFSKLSPASCSRPVPSISNCHTRAQSYHCSTKKNGKDFDATPPDPVADMLWAAQQSGMVVQFVENSDMDEVELLDDVMDDLEDPWMRNPSRE